MLKDIYSVLKHKIVGGLLIFILGLHYFGVLFSFYRNTSWYDIPMHFLGGAWVALLVIYWPGFKNQFHTFGQKLIFILLCVMIVGLAWEIMEIYIDGLIYLDLYSDVDGVRSISREFKAGWTSDSFGDLGMDALGGFVATYMVLRKNK